MMMLLHHIDAPYEKLVVLNDSECKQDLDIFPKEYSENIFCGRRFQFHWNLWTVDWVCWNR